MISKVELLKLSASESKLFSSDLCVVVKGKISFALYFDITSEFSEDRSGILNFCEEILYEIN